MSAGDLLSIMVLTQHMEITLLDMLLAVVFHREHEAGCVLQNLRPHLHGAIVVCTNRGLTNGYSTRWLVSVITYCAANTLAQHDLSSARYGQIVGASQQASTTLGDLASVLHCNRAGTSFASVPFSVEESVGRLNMWTMLIPWLVPRPPGQQMLHEVAQVPQPMRTRFL